MRLTVTLPALAALLLSAPAFAGGDAQLKFEGSSYPLEMLVQPSGKTGVTAYLGRFSEIPGEDYDTVLVQGLLPSPDMRLEAVAKAEHLLMTHTPLRQEGFARFPNGRFWARFRAPAATRQPVRFAVTDLGLKQAETLTLYETEVYLGEPQDAQPVSTAPYIPDPALFTPASAPFKLVRRAEWKANPPKEPYSPHSPYFFTIHHTQAHYPATFEASLDEMRFIQDFHQNGRGWNDIAYHYLIDPAGNVFEGRPVGVVGAHVKNRNTGNVGVSILGNYHPPSKDRFTDAAQGSFVTVGRWIKDSYSVKPAEFYAHREIGSTDCPGDNLYAKKDLLKGLVFAPAAQDVPAPEAGETPAQAEALRALYDRLNGR